MIDPVKILQRAWHILWNYRTLWVFGLILALAAGGGPSGNGDNNNGVQWRADGHDYPTPSYGSPQEFFQDMGRQIQDAFREGIPALHISGGQLTAFLWTLGVFVLFMILVGIVISIAYYVSVTAVIRMVDEYENSGTKMNVRQGFRIGWSRRAWHVFLINLIVHLPGLLYSLALLIAGVMIAISVFNGEMNFNPVALAITAILVVLGFFGVLIVTFILMLLRPFYWRVAVLEDAGVGESLRRGWAMVRENWKSAGVMWLVMIGLGIVWIAVSIILFFITLPLLLVTAAVAAVVVALPGLLLVGLFSTYLSGWLPWAAAGLFLLPLFFPIAFSPWVVLGSWQKIYTSTVWTLTYREIKALPTTFLPPTDVEPVGD
jgi:hypothetical protein